MKDTVIVKVQCLVCGHVNTEYELCKNEFGYFTVADGYCPRCLSLLDQIIDHNDEKICEWNKK